MKRPTFFSIFSMLFFILAIQAQAAEREKKFHFFSQLELWYDSSLDGPTTSPELFDTVRSDVDEKAFGIRVGALFPMKNEGTSAGFSIGYVKGPESSIDATDSGSSDFLSANVDFSFIRLIGEIHHEFPITDTFGWKLRGGLGLARGEFEASGSGQVLFGFAPLSFSNEDDWTGVTFELGPSVVFSGEKTQGEIGLLYAFFPDDDENFAGGDFEYRPFSIHAGIHF